MISTTVRPGFSSSFVFQRTLELRACIGRRDALVVRVHHRNQAGVRRALHVVLAAQRMQAGAGPADLAGHQRQRDQAARVVGAVDVLRDAHPPEDHRSLRGGEPARDGADRLGRDAADRRHRLRAEAFDVALQVGVAAGAVAHEVLVDEALLDDRVHHRVQQRDVGVRLELKVVGRVARQLAAPRVGQDQRGAGLHRVLDPGCGDRMVDDGICADDQHDVGELDVADRVRDRAGAEALEQRGDARRVAEAGAVVDVVGPKARADQLLEQVGFLVAALGRAEAAQRLRAELVADPAQAACCDRERFFPRRLAEHRQRIVRVHHEVGRFRRVGSADQRLGQALAVVDVVEAVATLDAEPSLVGRPVATVDADDVVVLHAVGQLAADAAVRADRVDALVRFDQADAARRHQGAGRAGAHALAAGHAGARPHRIAEVEDDLGVGARASRSR
jgi:hypothetical protein